MATTTELADRLSRGWQIIEEKSREPPSKAKRDEIEKYTDHWIALLRQYEAADMRERQPWQQSVSQADSPATRRPDIHPMEQPSLL